MSTEPDTLQSIARLRVVDAVCEGEIEGLVNGPQSIYLDSTQIQNSNGTSNYPDVHYEFRPGTQGQARVSWLKGTESAQSVGVEVKQSTPIERTIVDGNADAARITMTVPQLYRQDDDGDLHGTSVQYTIAVKTATGSYVDQPVQWDWINLPGSGSTWTSGTTTNQCTKIRGSLKASCALPYNSGVSGSVSDDSVGSRALIVDVQYRPAGSGSYVTAQRIRFLATPSNRSNYAVNLDTAWTGGIGSFEFDVPFGSAYDVRVVGATGESVWFTPVQELQQRKIATTDGKTMSAYQRSHVVTLPAGGAPWTIRVTRVTADSIDTKLSNKTYWSDITSIYEEKLRYPNTALVAMEFDAKQFSTVPQRAYRLRLLKVKIPTNYDPISRTYDGEWDGTFQTAWTNNPVWCWYDLATNRRYGCGDYITEDMLDKWAMYEMARYCDELVPDGRGGMEPRFSCNLYLQTREEAYRVLANMAAIFRAMIFWGAGGVALSQDRPKDPVYLFANANVIDGHFQYVGSSIKVRHNAVMVAWNDPKEMFRQVVEYVDDPELIARWGYVSQTEIVALGCTSRAMAYRVGRWLLYTERYESESVTFETGLEGNIPRPGDVIAVADQHRAGARMGGRILSVPSATTVQLDQPVTLDSGVSYTLSVVNDDGSVEDRAVTTAASTTDTLTIDSAWTVGPSAMSIWVLSSAALASELYRVVSVAEKEGGSKFQIAGVLYNPSKFDYVDQGQALAERDTTLFGDPTQAPDAPSGLTATDSIYIDAARVVRSKITFSWQPVSAQFVRGYIASYRAADSGNWIEMPETQTPAVDILDARDGQAYELRVASVSQLGLVSGEPDSIAYTPLGKSRPPATVASITATVNAVTGQIELAWLAVADLDIDLYEVRVGASWEAGTPVFAGQALRCTVPAVGASMTFLVRALDTSGSYSSADASVSVTIQLPLQPTVVAEVIDNNVLLRWNTVAQSLPVDTYEIRRGATWASATVIGTKAGLFTTIFESQAGAYTYWVAAIDRAGNYGTPGAVPATVSAPPDYVLQLSQAITWGTLSNAAISGGGAVLPVDTAETFSAHFTSRGWTTPQAQINAGYPVYVQPGLSSGYVEAVIDAGATLASSKITMNYSLVTVTGAPAATCIISVSNTSATGPWTDYAGVQSVYAAAFRWVKIKVAVTGGIASIQNANIRMEVKEKTESGEASVVSTDSGGTTVTFTGTFASVKEIQLTPRGTSARYAVYDFAGGANPTSFKILLFDTAGTRQSGTVGWKATGV